MKKDIHCSLYLFKLKCYIYTDKILNVVTLFQLKTQTAFISKSESTQGNFLIKYPLKVKNIFEKNSK